MLDKRKIISYSFFEPLVSLPSLGREWDVHRGAQLRYWYNIPAVILGNSLTYPDYITRMYVTSNVFRNPLSKIFDILSDHVEIVEIDMEYSLTEPSILRMKPVWEDFDIVHVKDIDSIPTEIEYRLSKSFEESCCTMYTLREHKEHWYLPACMLAGLSGFKPKEIPEDIKLASFDEYQQKAHKRYGCDQDLMIQVFCRDRTYLEEHFYDCEVYEKSRPQGFKCKSCTGLEKINIEPEIQEVFDVAKTFVSWSGEPVDARGTYTDFVLSKFPDVLDKINSNQEVYDLYNRVYQ